MTIELKVPTVGESITEVEIGEWRKAVDDHVNKDETVVIIETEKATVELPAPAAGTLTKILKPTGAPAKVGEIIGQIEESRPAPKAVATPDPTPQSERSRATPVAERVLAEHSLRPEEVPATGPSGRVTKEDVLRHVEKLPKEQAPVLPPSPVACEAAAPAREEQVVRMTLLRRTVARRLVEGQHAAALLTTFNEIDMSIAQTLRHQYQEGFQKKYGIKLGLMSFFVKAVVDALKLIPQLNAEIRGDDIVYRNYHDIGIAVSTERGLVVPVLHDTDRLSFAEIERAIADFAQRAQQSQLQPTELEGGTFTITNGGVFGSLLSTPIINPPQSGVLGMHAIQDRPVAVAGQVVIRPMMYVALTYDHRLVDGREAVTFLRHVKEIIEKPARTLLEV